MRAADLAEKVPFVRRSTTGAEAARVVAEYRLPGLVVVDDDGVPTTVIPGSQLLDIVVPLYVRDDPKLAHAYDEKGADELCDQLNRTTIGDLLDSRDVRVIQPPSVLPDDTLLEVATTMAQEHFPLLLVKEKDGTFVGTILLSRVLAQIARRAGQDSDLVERRLTRDLVQRREPWSPPDPEADGGEGRDR